MVRLLLGLDETGCAVPLDEGDPYDVLITDGAGLPSWVPIAEVTDDIYLSSVSFVGDTLRFTMSEGTLHNADLSSFRVSSSSLPITGSGTSANPLGLLIGSEPGNMLRLGADNGLVSAIDDIATALTGMGFGGAGSGGGTHPAASGSEYISVTSQQVVSLLNHPILSKHTVSGSAMQVVGLTATDTLGLLTPSSNPGVSSEILKTDTSGYVTVVRAAASERITTPAIYATGDLLIDPVGNVVFFGDQTIRSSVWTPGLLGTGWGLQERASGKSHLDIRSIYTDELIAATFTADNVRVRAGSDWLSESMAIATRDNSDAKVTIPTNGGTVTIYVEDSAAVSGRIFDPGEHVLIKSISRESGIATREIWGTVTNYAVQPNGRQSYTWTTTSNSGGAFVLEPGVSLVGFGVTSGSYIYRTVIEAGRGPLERFATWSTNPYTPSNRLSRVEIGDLRNAIGDATTRYGIAGGNNLGLTPTTGFSGFQANSVDGMKLYSVDIDLYNAGVQTVHIGKAGDNLWVGPSSADKHLNWASGLMTIKGAIVVQPGSSGIATFSDAGDLAVQDTVDWNTQVSGSAGVNSAIATAQTTADNAASAASAAQSSANTANATLANIASDSILSPNEKPQVVSDYNTIIGEQAGIDARAGSYGITTERTAYNNSITNLTSYLGTIPGWNTIPGSDVAIVGTTFRSKFYDVYIARQVLLNEIARVAGLYATWGNVSSKPIEITDGRIALGLTASTGTVKQNIYSADIAAAGTPEAPKIGLNLNSTRFGYNVDGTSGGWRTWIAHTGQFYFGNTGGAHLEWDNTFLKGVDSLNTVQWAASSNDGRIYAGDNNVMLSQYGLDVIAYDVSSAKPIPIENVRAVAWWGVASANYGTDKPYARVYGYVNAGHEGFQLDVDPGGTEEAGFWIEEKKLWLHGMTGVYGIPGASFEAALIALSAPLSITGTVTARSITPESGIAYDLGSAGVKWRKLYVQDVIADSISGAAMSGATWRNDAGDMYIYSASTGSRTLYIANDGAGGVMHLDVEGNIAVGGTVDGIDVGSFYTTYTAHTSNVDAHHTRAHAYGSASDHTGFLPWGKIDKTDSSLADLATRTHAQLTGVGEDDHHSKVHNLIGTEHAIPTLTPGHVLRASATNAYSFAAIQDADIPATLVRTSFTLTGGNGINAIGDLSVNRTISVKADTLITVSASGVAVSGGSNLYQVIATSGVGPYPPSWTNLSTFAGGTTQFTSGKFAVKLASVSGLNEAGDGLEIANTVAGNGLQIASKVISAKPSTLITVAAGGISLSVGTAQYQTIVTGADPYTPTYTLLSTFAGNGLRWSAGAFAIELDPTSGLQINSNRLAISDTVAGDGLVIASKILAIGTPGTLTATTVSGTTADSHVHTITATDTPTNVSLLKSNASGGLTLTGLTAPSVTSTIDLTLSAGSGYAVLLNAGGVNTASVNVQRIIPAGSGIRHLGDYNRKWGDIWGSNFVVDVLVANEIMATIGGNLLVTPTTTLIEDLGSGVGDTTIKVKHVIPTGSGTFMRMNGLTGATPKAETIKLTSDHTPVTGGYSYTCQRNASGSPNGAQSWLTGDGLASTGKSSGHGWIEMVSFQTQNYNLTQYGPTMTIYNRTGLDWDDVVPMGAFGNLRSLVGYSGATDTVGIAIGADLTQPLASFSGITVDATSGLRLFNTDFRVYDAGSEVIFLGRTKGLRFTPPVGEPGIGYYLNAVDWWDSAYNKPMISIDAYRSGTTVYSRYSVDTLTMDKAALATLAAVSDAARSATIVISARSGAVTTSGVTVQSWSSDGYGGVAIDAYKRDVNTGNTIAGDITLNGSLNVYGIGTSHTFAGNTSFSTSYTYTFNGQLVSNTMRDINGTTKIKLSLGLDVRNGADDAYMPISAKNIWLSDLNQTLGTHTIWTSGNDGSGTGLDADLVDGQHASAFWQASNDGTGSGLDADLLDGYHGSNFIGRNGNSYYQIDNWLQWGAPGAAVGLYFPNSGAGTHFYPNPDYYGAFKITGAKGGYTGLHFESGYLRPLLMFSVGIDNHGFWLQDVARWTLKYASGSWYCDEDLMWDEGNTPGRAVSITGAWSFTSFGATWSGHGFRNTYDGVNVYDHYFPSGTLVDTTANLRVNKSTGGYRTLVFSGNDTFQWDGRTIYHTGNLNMANYAAISGATFTGNVLVPATDGGFQVNSAGGVSIYTNEINVKGNSVLYLGYRNTAEVTVIPTFTVSGNFGGSWNTMSLTSPWTTFDSTNWGDVRYRKIGDLVFLEGMPARPSGYSSSIAIATLPSGYRPGRKTTYVVNVSVAGSWQAGRIDVRADGVIDLIVPSTSATLNWVSFGGVCFSTTVQ